MCGNFHAWKPHCLLNRHVSHALKKQEQRYTKCTSDVVEFRNGQVNGRCLDGMATAGTSASDTLDGKVKQRECEVTSIARQWWRSMAGPVSWLAVCKRQWLGLPYHHFHQPTTFYAVITGGSD